MSREIAHMKVFGAALESMNLDPFAIGKRDPDPKMVEKYFNDSTGEGELGKDSSGPWTHQEGWELVNSPAFEAARAR